MALLARLSVRARERLSPSFVRLELAGPELVDLGVAGPTYDIRIKLLFAPEGGQLPELGEETWWTDFQALPEPDRGHVRTYTIREVRGSGADAGIVVDFVLHPGAHGPGSGWAGAARVGDELLAVLPRRGEEWGGVEWQPGASEQLLIVGDETAVPAVCSIVESLPAEARGTAYLEVPETADIQRVRAPSGFQVRWLPRDGAPIGSLAMAALGEDAPHRPVPVPETTDEEELVWETPTFSASGEPVPAVPGERTTPGVYAWIAGESTMVRTLRRHLVGGVGMPREQVSFMGYWREGVAMRA